MNGRRRTGEIVDLVDFHIERESHVVAQQLEIWTADQVGNILLSPGEEIVDAKHVVPFIEQAFAQMRAEEARAPRDHHAFT